MREDYTVQKSLQEQKDITLEEVDRLIELCENTPLPRPDQLLLKAYILSDMGDCRESIRLVDRSIALKDSLGKIEYVRQVDGLRTQYEADRHIAEKQQAHLSFYFASSIGVLLLVALVIWMFYSRKIHKKNVALVDKILAQEKDSAEIEKLRRIAV